MNQKPTILFFITLFLLTIWSIAMAAPEGKIAGRVIDATSENPLPGANIVIEGTTLGASSDVEGVFIIPNVPVGNYTLTVVYIGYERMTVTDILVEEDRTTTREIKMMTKILEGEAIEVTAQAEGQFEAINQQLSARQIMNVISESKIQEVPDVNAAEAISRLPGVSVVRSRGEASEIVVRGLSDGNLAINVDGMRLQATGDNRELGLAMIPMEMMAGIELTKAVTPDMDADATGSTINIKLRSAREGFRTRIQVQPGYNAQQESFRMVQSAVDVSNRFFDQSFGVMASASVDFMDRGTNQFSANYGTSSDYIPGEISAVELNSVALNDLNTLRDRYSGSLILDYKMPIGKLVMSNFFSRLKTENEDYSNSLNLNDQTVHFNGDFYDVTTDVLQSGLLGEFNILNSKLDAQAYFSLTEVDKPDDNYLNSAVYRAFGNNIKTDTRITASPEEIPSLLELPSIDDMKVASSGVRSSLRKGTEFAFQANWETPFTISNFFSGYFKLGGKFRNLERESKNTRSSATWVSQGTRIQNPNRVLLDDHPEMNWETYEGVIKLKHFITDPNPTKFLDDYMFYYPLDGDLIRQCNIWCSDPSVLLGRLSEEAQNFTDNEKLSAGYLMAGFNLGPQVSLITGVRYEHENIDFDAVFFDVGNSAAYPKEAQANAWRDTSASRQTDHWFPMAQIKYKPTDWFDVRLSYSNTIKRPNYNQYNPRVQLGTNAITTGTINLKSELSTNYDAYFSIYNDYIGLFTVGGFYKQIENKVYTEKRRVDERDGIFYTKYPDYTITRPTNNPNIGDVYGVEFDLQTPAFWYLPGFLKGFVLRANFTLIHSETDYNWFYDYLVYDPDDPFGLPIVVEVDTSRAGRVQDQPRFVGNVILGYDIGGFSARLSVNFQDNTATNFNRTVPELDAFTKDWNRWNITVSQKVGNNLQFFGNFSNLTNTAEASYLPGRYGHLSYEQRYGWVGTVGIRYLYPGL